MVTFMTSVDEFRMSVDSGNVPPNLTPELESLWHTKAGHWEQAHDIAQDIHTPMGSWIHALLHLIEGDTGNAGYWFRQADRPVRATDGIDELWTEIVGELLQL